MSELLPEYAEELTRWLEDAGPRLARSWGVQPGATVLDFGCGAGRFAAAVARAAGPTGEIVVVDKRDEALAESREKIGRLDDAAALRTLRGVGAPALADERADAFDAALLFDVLQHLDDRTAVFARLAELVKPGGLLSVYPSLRVHPDAVDWPAVRAELAEAGFDETGSQTCRMPHANHMIDDEVFLFRLR